MKLMIPGLFVTVFLGLCEILPDKACLWKIKRRCPYKITA